MRKIKGTPPELAKEVVLALFRLMQNTEGPEEFAFRAKQAMEAALHAKMHGKSEAELLAIIEQGEAQLARTQPPARA